MADYDYEGLIKAIRELSPTEVQHVIVAAINRGMELEVWPEDDCRPFVRQVYFHLSTLMRQRKREP